MRILEKLLLLVFSLCLMALGGAGVWCCFDTNLLKYVNMIATIMTQNRWITLIAAGGLLLVGLLILFGVVFSSSGKRSADNGKGGVVIIGDAASNVQISTSAVDCIIQQLRRSFADVNEMDTRITTVSDGVDVLLKVTASSNANFPQMASSLQNAVKEQLENMVGLRVASVKVVIADVVQAAGGYTPASSGAAEAGANPLDINTEKNTDGGAE